MKGYLEFFIGPVPKKKLSAVRKEGKFMARKMLQHGALEFRESVGDNFRFANQVPFPKRIKLRPGEVLIATTIKYHSRKHRDQVYKRLFKDKTMKQHAPPIDISRVVYGGFSTRFLNKKKR